MKISYNPLNSKIEVTHATHNGAAEVLAAKSAQMPTREEMNSLRAKLLSVSIPRGTHNARAARFVIAKEFLASI